MCAIIEQVARTLWAEWWAQEHAQRLLEDFEHELPWRDGDDLEEAAPPTPSEAYIDAGRLVGKVEALNGRSVDGMWARALELEGREWRTLSRHDREDSRKEFGYYLVQEALRSGITWEDDHEDWELEVPEFEVLYMPAAIPDGDGVEEVMCSCGQEDPEKAGVG